MADTMQPQVQRNQNDDNRVMTAVTIADADVDLDGSGDVEIVIGDLRYVDFAKVLADDGYKADIQSISINTVTVRLYDYGYLTEVAADAPADALTGSPTNVCGLHIIAEGSR